MSASSPGVFIGMDEAGYGPNLGPLVIVATRWQTPGCPTRCDFYQQFKAIVSAEGHAKGKMLHVADSKLVNVGKHGFRELETAALALMHCMEMEITSLHQLWGEITGQALLSETVSSAYAPWYATDLQLPVAADRNEVQRKGEILKQCMLASGASLLEIRSDLVVEQRFNRQVEANENNKGLMLSRLAFALLRSVWDPAEQRSVLIVGDKHGGRNRYDELLGEILNGEMIFRIEEGQQMSRYRVNATDLRFQVGGESHLPVACASIIAKYLRELTMDQLNQYWSTHCQGVKPTRGYPNDARRFRKEVETMRLQLQIAEQDFWRVK